MRPLVVLTGQGISRADGFDLERELRDAIEEEVRRCFDLPRDSRTLDDVFSAARRHSMQYLEALVRATRRTCIAARESGVRAHHREVFGALRDAAANRVVVHVTTNIDGIATTVAVKVFGAVWRPVERYGEEIPIADIRRDVLEVFAAGSGQLHLPVHGEAGLAAVKGLPEWEGAQRLVQTGLQHDTAYSTLAQGIGQTVREIETLMAVSGLGYGLLASLLVGTVADVDRMIGPYPPADLVTIGYGAGATDGRLAYPFERRLREARQRGFSPQGSRWLALVYRGDSEDADSPAIERTAGWYDEARFEVRRYGKDELGAAARAAIASVS